MDQLKLGVIGLGSIAQVFHLPHLKKFAEVKLHAISDSDTYKLNEVAKKIGVTNCYEDPFEMIDQESLDGLLVLTPTNLHFPLLKKALLKKIPAFVERPPVLNLEELTELVELSSAMDTFVQVGSNMRFDQDIILLKDFISKRELGEVIHANVFWLQSLNARSKSAWNFNQRIAGGGVLMDLGFVMIDLLLWIMQDYAPYSLKAVLSKNRINKKIEDFATVYIHFRQGGSAIVEVTWDNVHPEDKYSLKFYGTEGYASYPELKFYKEFQGRVFNMTPETFHRKQTDYRLTYASELNYFVKTLEKKIKPVCTLEEFVPVYRIIQSAYISAATNKEILL